MTKEPSKIEIKSRAIAQELGFEVPKDWQGGYGRMVDLAARIHKALPGRDIAFHFASPYGYLMKNCNLIMEVGEGLTFNFHYSFSVSSSERIDITVRQGNIILNKIELELKNTFPEIAQIIATYIEEGRLEKLTVGLNRRIMQELEIIGVTYESISKSVYYWHTDWFHNDRANHFEYQRNLPGYEHVRVYAHWNGRKWIYETSDKKKITPGAIMKHADTICGNRWNEKVKEMMGKE
mgnify:CR=1 FL=1